MKMKKTRRSIWPEVATILLIISLLMNAVFAAAYVKLSKETEKTIEQLEMRVEEYTSLMQERQDALTYESEKLENDMDEKNEKLNKEVPDVPDFNKNNETELISEDRKIINGQETENRKMLESEKEEEIDGLIEDMDNPVVAIADQYVASREANGEKWSVSVENLSDNQKYVYHASEKMQSASVIKVFIMGAVYDRMCYPSSPDRLIAANESYDGELRNLLEQMITISDNAAANQLITKLGEGDFKKGAEVVNQFCQENGYLSTSVGRAFLESNPTGDNYTSAADCTKILSDIYHGTCVNEEASGKMLEILKNQTVKTKISMGVPVEIKTANKTGEMPEGYGLGCIENDMAIVFTEKGDYIITVLSNELGGRNDEAKQVIRQISSEVWKMMQASEIR